ncbi:MAG: mannose-6-phosphate isomerase, class I [Anaerolineae bacterium]|nr:mannose-6-phosphate isomerase, class I [Anaerolineae bacterium]
MSERTQITARPYRLHNQIQNYAWGTRDNDAFIPHLLQFDPQPGVPYAELWIGTHPKAPSQVELPDGSMMLLHEWIAQEPRATLGKAVNARFGGLPFLFKVLSAGQSLSIQAHPNKAQAEMLHEQDPAHYPDDNHKPEIAIALDHLTALMGFKPFDQLVGTLSRYPEIADFVGRETVNRIVATTAPFDVIAGTLTRELFAELIQHAIEDPPALSAAVDAVAQRLTGACENPSEAETLFLELGDRYGNQDVGLFALFLLNIVHLKSGEALFTEAGVPHAYLKGNIVECIASSDNVVRVGLTPKFRDAAALIKIVDTTPRIPKILDGSPTTLPSGVTTASYPVPAPEFEMARLVLPAGADFEATKGDRPAIALVIRGSIDLLWDGQHDTYAQGASAFLPACLDSYTVRATEDAEVMIANVPAV